VDTRPDSAQESSPSPVDRLDSTNRQPDLRLHPRVDMVLPVALRILVEENTFSPFQCPGKTRNVSMGGMLVEIESLPEQLYKTLIRRQRLVRITLHYLTYPTVLLGRIVWYDFRKTSRGSCCLVGIKFEDLSATQTADLQKLIP
jgi:hypothetical protein